MLNNVLGTLKYDITASATSLVITPLTGTTFNLPPGGTDPTGATTGGTATYGKPVETFILADRLDLSQAKYEIIQCTTRVPESAGAYTHTVIGRGAEGSTATAWTASNTVYVFQVTTAAMIDLLANGWVMRAQHMLAHKEIGILSWDLTTFKFANFRALGNGRGSHASSQGYLDITMPPNGTVAIGYGGAANCTAALGGWPLANASALYYEPNISGVLNSVNTNFRIVGYTVDFIVPQHWIFIAVRADNSSGNDGTIRVCNGATLPVWHAVGSAGEPAFENSWVNYGGGERPAQFAKSADQIVRVNGVIKNGSNSTTPFTLPVGFRPPQTMRFTVSGGAAIANVDVSASGAMTITFITATNGIIDLSAIQFQAGN